MRQMVVHTIQNWQSSNSNHVFRILGEVGAELKVSILRPAYLKYMWEENILCELHGF